MISDACQIVVRFGPIGFSSQPDTLLMKVFIYCSSSSIASGSHEQLFASLARKALSGRRRYMAERRYSARPICLICERLGGRRFAGAYLT